jgi:hypothetical protein
MPLCEAAAAALHALLESCAIGGAIAAESAALATQAQLVTCGDSIMHSHCSSVARAV